MVLFFFKDKQKVTMFGSSIDGIPYCSGNHKILNEKGLLSILNRKVSVELH